MDNIFIECFGDITDPRVERTRKHFLIDIIAIAICAVTCGAEGFEEIEDFGLDHQEWFSRFLELPNDIPSHDTFSRVFSALHSGSFQKACIHWFHRVKEMIPETVVSIDGKTLRGSSRKGAALKALHVVNAWSCSNGLSLGQLKVDDKSNEITAIPRLLQELELKGAIVTLDAMGCQEEVVRCIRKAEADYIIALKGNQGQLQEVVKDSFVLMDQGSKALTVTRAEEPPEGEHGRIDQRKIEVIDAAELKEFIDERWLDLKSLIRITYQREDHSTCLLEQRYYISSLNPNDPLKIMRAIRAHWQIENCLHWSLDVIFNEDASRIRDENAALNFSWMRKFSLGLLRGETTFKASIRRKQRRAAVNHEYLSKVMRGL